MAMTLDGSNGVTFNDSSLQGAAASPFGLKNRIINGDMRIDQRYAGAATANTIADYTLDRWNANQSVTGKYTIQQNAGSVTPPTGFTNYLGITSSSAYSLLSGSYYFIQQNIEGFNVADLGWGTANAQTVTLSFWVRSSLTGTFGGSLLNSAANRSYPFSYTISSANTWTKITITILGDTSGTWLTTNGVGIRVNFSVGAGTTFSGTAGSWNSNFNVSATGATSVVGTNGATWYVTGVQLEIGTSATPFERRLYNQELANCQRYYYRANASANYTPYGFGWNASTSAGQAIIQHPVQMRSIPTSIDYNLLSSTQLGASEALVVTATLSAENSPLRSTVATASSGAFASGFFTLTAKASTSSYLGFSAEL